jgi:ribosomal protein S18 acetylase RimI-like enzyme
LITIRTANPSDITQLVELLQELFSIETDFVFDKDKQTNGLNLLLKSDKDCILVAESANDNKVLGMCTIQTLISTAEGGQVGLLEDLIVAAVNWSEVQGLKRLQLLADKNNLPALGFYKNQGWLSTELVCLRKLS